MKVFTDVCNPVWERQRQLLPLPINWHVFSIVFGHLEPQKADPGVDADSQRYLERIVNNLKKKAHALGFDLVAQPTIELEQCAN